MVICVETQKLLFWRGCTLRHILPEVAQKAVQIIRKAGLSVTTLDDEGCCGYPFLLSGYEERFREYASKALSRIENIEYDAIVVHCPGCLRTFKEYYPKHGLRIAKDVLHTSQLLYKLLRNKALRFAKRINFAASYHDPCDLCRHLGICDEPREIIELVPGITFVELPETVTKRNSRCCGGGGLLRLTMPMLATQLAIDRIVEDFASLNIQVVITSCPTCTKSLRDAVLVAESLYGISLTVLDIIDIVYDALG